MEAPPLGDPEISMKAGAGTGNVGVVEVVRNSTAWCGAPLGIGYSRWILPDIRRNVNSMGDRLGSREAVATQ
jgi:hypothetical protein